ncbi:hypothetical protein AAVH_25118, partial [Aphelenchoides avenae]
MRNRGYRSKLPNECLLDVLRALNRDCLDSCELVCRRHRELIEAKADVLPLRHMTQLNLEDQLSSSRKLFITPCVVVFTTPRDEPGSSSCAGRSMLVAFIFSGASRMRTSQASKRKWTWRMRIR